MDILLYFLVGIVMLCVGIAIGKKTTKVDGLFLVNDTDYESTRWTLDVKMDPKDIPNKKEIRLKVVKVTEGDV